jgi:N-acetyl-gamma-glutamyl-phosphate reductase
MVKVGIAGATGYTGYELVKILQSHPSAEIAWLTSESYPGRKFSDVFPSPYEHKLIPLADAPMDEVDVVFLALPHGASMDAVRRAYDANVLVIDLSADFRLKSVETYEKWYGVKHTQPMLLREAVYGLPELHREEIAGARLIANPGCYPTAAILALHPLMHSVLLEPPVFVDAKSGVSGAGRKPGLKTHFVEVNENFSAYSVGYRHRHVAEMEQELGLAGPEEILFIPHLLPVNRGILETMVVRIRKHYSATQLRELYLRCYDDEPFVWVLPESETASLAHVVGTNLCAIGITPVQDEDEPSTEFVVTVAIDNLLKGASGQAVQNMNTALGLPEEMGLGVTVR